MFLSLSFYVQNRLCYPLPLVFFFLFFFILYLSIPPISPSFNIFIFYPTFFCFIPSCFAFLHSFSSFSSFSSHNFFLPPFILSFPAPPAVFCFHPLYPYHPALHPLNFMAIYNRTVCAQPSLYS